MAAGDFWKRITGEGITEATPEGQRKIPAHAIRALFMDVAIGSGGITVAQIKVLLKISGNGVNADAAQEFQDLVDSVANVTNANATVQRGLRMTVVEALSCGLLLADLGPRVGGGANPYLTGEALRLRLKALITALAPGGAAALVGTMAA